MERKLRETEGTISASSTTEDAKASLLTKINAAASTALQNLDDTIAQEEEFVSTINQFIAEILVMATVLDGEIATQSVYEGAAQFIALVEEVDGVVATAEARRIAAVVDLATYWTRLREMGDEVLTLQLAQQEVIQLLLENPF